MLKTLLDLTSALAIGLLIGAERGWRQREVSDLQQIAGLRTFALAGLLGGLATLLAGHLWVAVWVALLTALTLLVLAGYIGDLRLNGDQGMTSEMALLATFVLGSLALAEQRLLAAGCAVVVALLLSFKEPLHSALRRLSFAELSGTFKLLFISVVLLPVLPNQGYGPWAVFNPYTTWWMVVLIAGLGFAAYLAMRLLGARNGLLVTALLGGVISSTAMTLTLARLHERRDLQTMLASALLATSMLMFPRVLLEVGALNPALLSYLGAPLAMATLIYAGGAFYYWRQAFRSPQQPHTETPLRNPFELLPAVRFALLLALILLLVEAARRYLGDVGVYLVALISGLADVDAITLSLAGSARSELSVEVAAQGIALAVLSNSLVKGGLILLVGGRQLAWKTLPICALGLLLGGLVLLLS